MGLKEYSKIIMETKRGSNAFSMYSIKKHARSNAEEIKDFPYLWPVLEVGCGRGYFVQKSLELGIPIVGVDIDHRQLRCASARMIRLSLGTNVYQANAQYLPFADESFGSVKSFGMIMMAPFVKEKTEGKILSHDETVHEVRKIFSEIGRVTKKGGIIDVITFSDRVIGEPGYYKPTPAEFGSLVNMTGLETIYCDYMKGHHRNFNMIRANFRKV